VSQAGVLLAAKLRMGRHAIASVRTESKLKVGVVSFSAVALWFGMLILFHSAFAWLNSFGADVSGMAFSIGDLVMARMLSVMALSVFLMLVFSNVLVSFATFYRSREVAYLIQSPLSPKAFFLGRFTECVIFSSWALAYLGSPLMLAYGLAKGASPVFYISAFLFYIPFVIVPASIGCLITLTLVRVFPRLNTFSLLLIAGVVLALMGWYLSSTFAVARGTDENLLKNILDATAAVQSPFLPSYWASQGVLSAENGGMKDALFFYLLLTSNALMFTWIASEVSQRIHYLGWSFLAGNGRSRTRPIGRGILGRLDGWLAPIQNPQRALVIKDIKLFWRDPTQWSQFAIFFGLMAVYIVNLRGSRTMSQTEFWRNWVIGLNTGACTLILATLTSRFVFPLVSLEGRRFWILGLAPLDFRSIVWQKFWLSIATTSAFTVALAVLSCAFLGVAPVPFFLTVFAVVATNFGLSGLAVGLGTLYPNFQEENPARIVSGMGGTLNFLVSMAYIVLIVAAQAIILQWSTLGLDRYLPYGLGLVIAVVFIAVVSVVATLAPMRLGLKYLEGREF
jgi:ABC-2 type transport system permease protein